MKKGNSHLLNPAFDSSYFYLKLLSYILVTLFLLFFNTKGYSADVTLAWDPNTQTDLKGYKIYYGTATGNYQWIIDAGNVTTYTVSGLSVGATYFASATAYNTSGLESSYSNEVSFTLPGCTYSISPSSATFAASGGTGTINITTTQYCRWTASSDSSWVTVSTGSGQGSGSLSFTVSPNNNTTSQTATLTIAGNTYTITEAGKTQPTYSITASAGTGGTISPAGTVSVLAGAGQSFAITPGSNYKISNITVDGVSKGAIATYTFSSVSANHTINATFSASGPKATTKKPILRTKSTVSINGAVNPNSLSTTYYFEWGTTNSYGNTTQTQPVQSVNADTQTDPYGSSDTPVTADLTGLNPNTVYHYRVVAANSDGVSKGADQTFRASAASGDFNNDGNTDILWRNKQTGDVAVWYMDGTGNISDIKWISQGVDTTWEIVGTGDFDNNGNTDILWRNKISGAVAAWNMDGAGGISNIKWVHQGVDTTWEIVGTGDFDNSGNTDILWRNKVSGAVAVWNMDGGGGISNIKWVHQSVDTTWEIVGTGDFDNSGNTDILWRNKVSGAVAVWNMDGAGGISNIKWISQGVDTNWEIVGTGDFNNDGKTDILWRNKVSGAVAVWNMDGAGGISNIKFVSQGVDTSWKIVAP
jgi:hypothetical protein